MNHHGNSNEGIGEAALCTHPPLMACRCGPWFPLAALSVVIPSQGGSRTQSSPRGTGQRQHMSPRWGAREPFHGPKMKTGIMTRAELMLSKAQWSPRHNEQRPFISLQPTLSSFFFVSVRVQGHVKESKLYQVKIANTESVFDWEAFY